MTYYRDTTFRGIYRCFLLYEREAFFEELGSLPLYVSRSHVLVYGFADQKKGLMVSVLGFADITDSGNMNITRLPQKERIHKRVAELEDFEFWLLDGEKMGLADNYSDVVSYYDSLVPDQLRSIRELNALDEMRDRYFIDDVYCLVPHKRITVRLEGIRNHYFYGRAMEDAEGIRNGDEILVTMKLFNDHFFCVAAPDQQGLRASRAEEAILRYRQSNDKRDGRQAMDIIAQSDVYIPVNLHDVDEETRQRLEKELEEGKAERFSASAIIRPGSGRTNSYFPVFTSSFRLKRFMPSAAAMKQPAADVIRALAENNAGASGIAVNPDEKPVFLIPASVFPYLITKKTGEDEIPDQSKMS